VDVWIAALDFLGFFLLASSTKLEFYFIVFPCNCVRLGVESDRDLQKPKHTTCGVVFTRRVLVMIQTQI
jgi:hypothetical protein